MADLGRILGVVVGSVLGSGSRDGGAALSTILRGLAGEDLARQSGILAAVVSLIGGGGGLQSLLEQLRTGGLEHQVESWVGNAVNEDVTADQVRNALGTEAVSRVASSLGISTGQAGEFLARLLPEVVNQVTPSGSVSGGEDGLISRALDLLKGI